MVCTPELIVRIPDLRLDTTLVVAAKGYFDELLSSILGRSSTSALGRWCPWAWL